MFVTPREYFRLQDRHPRKSFGQHFLTQPETAERIVRSADLEESDVVVEVGPGLGALTRFLLPVVRCLHLVELDRDLAEHLRVSIPSSSCRVVVHQQDIMTFDFHEPSRLAGERLVVMGNLPYNISSPLVFHLLESLSSLSRAVFMVQKEVGDRLAASPGNKDYGVLSVLLGIYGRVSRLFSVGPGQFYPPPKVDSLVVRIDFAKEPPRDAPPFGFLRGMVNAAFQQRRKTLHNSLKGFVGNNSGLLDNALAEAGIDPKRRAETLSAEEFLRLGMIFRRNLTPPAG